MRLNRRCTQTLCHPLGRLITSRTDGRPFHRRDYFAKACSAINRFLRQTQKMAKADPHLFGPHASRYFHDTVSAAQHAAKGEAAIRKVYGPPQPGDPPPPPGVWTRRYFHDPQWKGFRKWFAKTYDAD